MSDPYEWIVNILLSKPELQIGDLLDQCADEAVSKCKLATFQSGSRYWKQNPELRPKV